MRQIGVWHVTGKGPQKLSAGQLDLEDELEEWIEKDPELLEEGLRVIGRQVKLENGKLDLLGFDLQARLVVIEVRKGIVSRDSIAQVIDYAASVATIGCEELAAIVDEYLGAKSSLKTLMEERGSDEDESLETRNARLFVVGTGNLSGMERIAGFLSKYQVPISIITYEVFDVGDGQRILIRELTESETEQVPAGKPRVTLEQLCDMADQHGIGEGFRAVRAAAQRQNLYPRLWTTSVMYTPPSNRTRMLFTVWAKPKSDKQLRVYIGSSVFPEFYPVKLNEAKQSLGRDGWRDLTENDTKKFIEGLDRLFVRINKAH